MIRWQYPPRQWPQVKSLTMVRKVAFGVGFGVLLILSVEVLYLLTQIQFLCLLNDLCGNRLLTFL